MLGAKFNSLRNGTVFNRGHGVKNGVLVQILSFLPGFPGKPCPGSFNDLC